MCKGGDCGMMKKYKAKGGGYGMMKKYKAKGGGYGINNKFINYNYYLKINFLYIVLWQNNIQYFRLNTMTQQLI